MFEKYKKDFLNKKDKSAKSSIDEDVIDLIESINQKEIYYTTSSCSGRIEIFEETGERSVNKLFASHNLVKFNQDFLEKIERLIKKSKNKVWLKQESLILHVCCKTTEDAFDLLKIARSLGLKRSGIISKNKKIIVEIINPEHLLTIIGENGALIADKNYFEKLVDEANEKLKRNKEKIKKLYTLISNNK